MTEENKVTLISEPGEELSTNEVVEELEINLTSKELSSLLLSQERMKNADLEHTIGKLRWEILIHQRKLMTAHEKVAIQTTSTCNQQVIMQIERRLKIRMSEYAFDDITGQLNEIDPYKTIEPKE